MKIDNFTFAGMNIKVISCLQEQVLNKGICPNCHKKALKETIPESLQCSYCKHIWIASKEQI